MMDSRVLHNSVKKSDKYMSSKMMDEIWLRSMQRDANWRDQFKNSASLYIYEDRLWNAADHIRGMKIDLECLIEWLLYHDMPLDYFTDSLLIIMDNMDELALALRSGISTTRPGISTTL
jgi:hypothetical protein